MMRPLFACNRIPKTHLLFFCCWLVLKTSLLQAQCPPRNSLDALGGFNLSVTRGCVPLRVEVSSEDVNVTSTTYLFNMQGTDYKKYSGKLSNRKDTTYTRPGKYTIIQLGSKNGTASFACQEIEVLPADKPTNYSWVSCAPNQVILSIKNDPAFKYDYYEVVWDAGGVPQNFRPGESQTHTYSNSLPRQVRITGRYNGLTCSASTDVSVSPSGPSNTAPRITRLEVINATTARLEYGTESGGTVDIFQKEAGGTYAKRFDGVGGPFQSISGLDNAGKQYCFQVRNVGASCPIQPLQSEELCTIPLNATAQDQQNQVRWTAHPAPRAGVSFLRYELRKNGVALPPFTNIGTASYTDRQVECGRTYSYQLTAEIRTGTGVMTTVSAPAEVVAINNTPPPPVTEVFATVTGPNQVELRWIVPPPIDRDRLFTISRAANGSNDYRLVGDTTLNSFADRVNTTAGSYCYRIGYQDLCSNNATPSEPVCTVFLERQGESLGWTSEKPFSGALQDYTIEQLDDNNAVIGVSNAGTRTSFQLDLNNPSSQQLRYRVRANSAQPGIRSVSNVVSLTLAMRLYVPDAFSPNGDSINETFAVQGVFIKAFKMTVFNRWGVPLFRTDMSGSGWDGTFNGQPSDAGSYSYAIEAEDFRGERFVKRGSFLLLR